MVGCVFWCGKCRSRTAVFSWGSRVVVQKLGHVSDMQSFDPGLRLVTP